MKKYAHLIARVGANIKKGQPVRIIAEADQFEFINLLVTECYKLGASRVDIDWTYQPITKTDYKYRSLKSLSEVPLWKEEKLKLMVEEIPCRIYIESEDPDGLKGVNREKMQKSQMARYKVTKKYSDALENKDQWTIAAVPSYAWAKKVFPNETKRNAYNKLWDAILETVYVTKDNDPVKEWDNHNKNLKTRTKWLNEKKFDYLEYKSSNGTNFRADLIPEAHWCGGGETRNVPNLLEAEPQLYVEMSHELAKEKGIQNGDGVIVESPRGKVEAIAMVTIRIRPFKVMGGTVHLVGMPFAFGWTTPGCGDSTNRLTIAACDPNTSIPELKACCVNIRKADRLTEID